MTMTAELSPPAAADQRPPVSVPDHQLLRVIGRGSYGEVWEARNVMGTPRAIKVIRRSDFDSDRPFEREFEGIQRYEPVSRTHAGLVQVLHVGRDEATDSFYYVMELADNALSGTADYAPRTLRSELKERGMLPVGECIETGINLASALGHLHRSGLVHRDVKPANIIYVDGIPKLADVGLVAMQSDSRSMVGTEGYYAPEGTGQPRSDVFSLGRVLYECVTGQDRLNFPDVPGSWGSGPESRAAFEFMEIVLRAAELDPARRYAGTDEMLADLALLKTGKSLRYLRRMETRLKRTLQVLAISSLIIAVVGGGWFYERYRRGQVEEAELAATLAQQETQRLLAESLLGEARALRLSGEAGARRKALEAIMRARDAGAPLVALRTEAASALALPDIEAFPPLDGLPRDWQPATVSPEGDFRARYEGGVVRIFHRELNRERGAVILGPDVIDIALGRNGRTLTAVFADRRLLMWDVMEKRPLWEDRVVGMPHLPGVPASGEWVAYRSEQGLVARECATGSPPVVLAADAPPLRELRVSPDGTWIAALPEPVRVEGAEKDLGFRIYSNLPGRMPAPEDAQRIRRDEIASDILLEGPSISADSRYLAAAVSEDRLRVWEMPSLSQIAWLRGHQRSVRATAFHPDNPGFVVSSSWDGTTRLWDIPTRSVILVASGGGNHIRLLPSRGEIIMRSWDGATERSAPLSRAFGLRVMMLPPQTRFGLFSGLAFSPDGRLVAAAGDAGVIAWELETGAPHVVLPAPEPRIWRDVCFDRSGSSMFCSGRDGLVRVNVVRPADDLGGPVGFRGPETVLEGWSGDLFRAGDRIAIAGRRSPEGWPVLVLMDDEGGTRLIESPFMTDLLSASPDGSLLAGAPYGAGAAVWDLRKDPPDRVEMTSRSRVAPGFTALGDLILGSDREVAFLTTGGEPLREPLPRSGTEIVPAYSALSHDRSLIAVSTGPTEITLLDGQSLETILKLDSSLTPFDCVMEFSPDGRYLAVAGGVSRVILWDLAWIRSQLTIRNLGW